MFFSRAIGKFLPVPRSDGGIPSRSARLQRPGRCLFQGQIARYGEPARRVPARRLSFGNRGRSVMARLKAFVVFAALVLALGLGLAAGARAGEPGGDKTIFVASNGWHTGIVIARADLPPGAIPETADFPNALYFEFGWGNREYYPAPDKTIGMTLRAITPSDAVVHLAGLPRDPREVFPTAEFVAARVSPEGFRRLVAFLNASFQRGTAPRVGASHKGLYAFSAFYPGTGTFHLFYTCNTWVADGLARAGLPVSVAGVQQAHEVMRQLRGLAR
jgi:uncharacterized protein (TIGR02117 family)